MRYDKVTKHGISFYLIIFKCNLIFINRSYAYYSYITIFYQII